MNSEIVFSICRLNSLVNSQGALMALKGEAGVTTAMLGTEICLELLPCVSSGKVPLAKLRECSRKWDQLLPNSYSQHRGRNDAIVRPHKLPMA